MQKVGLKSRERTEDMISPKQLLHQIVRLINADPMLMLSVSVTNTYCWPLYGPENVQHSSIAHPSRMLLTSLLQSSLKVSVIPLLPPILITGQKLKRTQVSLSRVVENPAI